MTTLLTLNVSGMLYFRKRDGSGEECPDPYRIIANDDPEAMDIGKPHGAVRREGEHHQPSHWVVNCSALRKKAEQKRKRKAHQQYEVGKSR